MKAKNYQKAKDRVKKKKEFREHLQAFIIVNLIMLGMGWMFGFYNAWLMVIFFWGIGLVFHYGDVYGIPGFGNDEDWEAKEMERELQRMEKEEAGDEILGPDDILDLETPVPEKAPKYNEEDLV